MSLARLSWYSVSVNSFLLCNFSISVNRSEMLPVEIVEETSVLDAVDPHSSMVGADLGIAPNRAFRLYEHFRVKKRRKV